jgi:DNA polymerase III subunit chi
VTEVEFHTGAVDPLGFACRLLRKAYRKGARVLITARSDRLAALNRELWCFDEHDFVPHVRVPGAPPALVERTPILLAEQALPISSPMVLVNLDADMPDAPSRFERVIEIVGNDVDEAQRGRERWRAYKAQGLAITHHTAPGQRT